MARATIKTIAQEAGVSIATVSKALNDMPDISLEVKARIREIAQRQGYIINAAAKELASGQSYFVGVILPDILSSATAQVYKSFSQRLDRAGYSAFLSDSGGDPAREAELALEMLKRRVGLLVIMPCTTDTRHIESAVKGQVPIIYIGGAVNPNAENSVACDDYKGGMLAAAALYGSGCKVSAVLTWGSAATAQHERSRGFVAYMQEKGAPVKVLQSRGGPDEACGRELARQMLEEAASTTGIFATDDLIAVGAMSFLKGSGIRVPEDMQFIGYGNGPCSSLEVIGLTSVAPPAAELGICSAEMALGILRSDADALRRLTLSPRLVQRTSTLHNASELG